MAKPPPPRTGKPAKAVKADKAVKAAKADKPSLAGRAESAPGTGGPALNQRQPPAQPPSAPSKDLQVFENPTPGRDYWIQFQVPEFTCHCPLTGQPDFAHFTIDMVADQLCVELKSLKMYFWSFRHEGAFHEQVTNTILDDIVAASAPRFVRITARWYVRGGIYTNVVAEHRAPGWQPPALVAVPAQAMERGLLG